MGFGKGAVRISVIIPVYNEEENIPRLYERLSEVLEGLPSYAFEVIFVDDGSTDKTLGLLKDLASKDKRIERIRFSRNFGSHAAIKAGLNFCHADAAIMLAGDLQDSPEIILSLIKKWQTGCKVVWAVRKMRKGVSISVQLFSRLYYTLMNHLTHVKQPLDGADCFIIDRVVVESFKQSAEKNTSIFMLISWFGFSQGYVEYVKGAREHGKSKWNYSKRLKLFIDSVVSFSYRPIRFMSFVGIVSALIGFMYGIIVLINSILEKPVPGWSSLMIVLLILGGFQMTMMGVLGEYIWRIYDESRKRLPYVIEDNTLEEKAEKI